MESKFIKNTNEQYSIREDGVLIRNYLVKYNINTQNVDIIFCTLEISKNTRGSVFIGKYISLNKLTRSYFGFVCCKKCNNKIEDLTESRRTKELCNNCKVIPAKRKYINRPFKSLLTEQQKKYNLDLSRKKYVENNPEKINKHTIKSNKNRYDNLPKYEIATRLGIPTHQLTDEMYEQQKALILTKRLLAKKLNCSIHSIK